MKKFFTLFFAVLVISPIISAWCAEPVKQQEYYIDTPIYWTYQEITSSLEQIRGKMSQEQYNKLVSLMNSNVDKQNGKFSLDDLARYVYSAMYVADEKNKIKITQEKKDHYKDVAGEFGMSFIRARHSSGQNIDIVSNIHPDCGDVMYYDNAKYALCGMLRSEPGFSKSKIECPQTPRFNCVVSNSEFTLQCLYDGIRETRCVKLNSAGTPISKSCEQARDEFYWEPHRREKRDKVLKECADLGADFASNVWKEYCKFAILKPNIKDTVRTIVAECRTKVTDAESMGDDKICQISLNFAKNMQYQLTHFMEAEKDCKNYSSALQELYTGRCDFMMSKFDATSNQLNYRDALGACDNEKVSNRGERLKNLELMKKVRLDTGNF